LPVISVTSFNESTRKPTKIPFILVMIMQDLSTFGIGSLLNLVLMSIIGKTIPLLLIMPFA
jgi:hypothetical protein